MYAGTEHFELIATDAGSGADRDVAFWRVSNLQTDFCSVGDVVTRNWNNPVKQSGLLLKALKQGAVAQPISFKKIWTDVDSGADSDIAIYEMNAPSGYKCLGKQILDSQLICFVSYLSMSR